MDEYVSELAIESRKNVKSSHKKSLREKWDFDDFQCSFV